MRAIPPLRLAKAIVGASLTFLAMSLFAPAPVKADCPHPNDRPAVDLAALHLDGPGSDQAPPPKPCSGPSCSNKSAPPATSAPQPPPRSELWGLAGSPTPVAPPDPSGWPSEDTLERPVRLATSIFHPPRRSR